MNQPVKVVSYRGQPLCRISKLFRHLLNGFDEHIDQPLNIDVVAKKSGYSKWYLQRMFRPQMHQTPGEYHSVSAGYCWQRRRYAYAAAYF